MVLSALDSVILLEESLGWSVQVSFIGFSLVLIGKFLSRILFGILERKDGEDSHYCLFKFEEVILFIYLYKKIEGDIVVARNKGYLLIGGIFGERS